MSADVIQQITTAATIIATVTQGPQGPVASIIGSLGVIATLAAGTYTLKLDSSYSPTFANVTSPGTITANVFSGASASLSSLTVNGVASITTTGNTGSVVVTDTGVNGSNIKLTGNGATTPSKTIRASGGNFQIINSAYNGVLFNLNDVGYGVFTSGAAATTLCVTGGNANTVGFNISANTTQGLVIDANTGTFADFALVNPQNTSYIMIVPTGTLNASFYGSVTATNHIGPGTGLTGTAASLSIGGNAATATLATTATTANALNSANSYSVTGFSTAAFTALGNSVTQAAPSTTNIASTASLSVAGNGSNGLWVGQNTSGTNYTVWMQSSFSNPTTAVYPLSLNPLGGNVGIGLGASGVPSAALQISTATVGNTALKVNSASLGTTINSTTTVADFYYGSSNIDHIYISARRIQAGTDWTTTSTYIQKIVDVSAQGYIKFGDGGTGSPAGTDGLILGAGTRDAIYINSSGNVAIQSPASGTSFTVYGPGASSATPVFNVTGGSQSVYVLPSATVGNYNPITQAGDLLIAGAGTSAGTNSNLTLAPWSGSAVGIRLSGAGTVNISGTTNINGRLNIVTNYAGSPANDDAMEIIDITNSTNVSGLSFSGSDNRVLTLTVHTDNHVALRATTQLDLLIPTVFAQGNVGVGGYTQRSVLVGIAAAGTTQGTATVLAKELNTVSSGTGGVQLPSSVGTTFVVWNNTGAAILVYPPSGSTIDYLATNVGLSLPAGSRIMFIQMNSNSYCSLNSTYA